MTQSEIDLKREQQASMARPRYRYSWVARFFFVSMDLVTGRKATLAKARLLEILAGVPYRAWEVNQYGLMTRSYRDRARVDQARRFVRWSREAQDNEYWHLLVIAQKMKAENMREPWYLVGPVPWFIVWSYGLMSRLLALFNLRRAFLFNGEFEDHAEHEYAQLVADNPAWESQSVEDELVSQYSKVRAWADVFRRIGLDERDHRNQSFAYSGKMDQVVRYEAMPVLDLPAPAG